MPFIRIENTDDPRLFIYTRSSESQLMHINEPGGEGIFIAETEYIISLALDAGYEPVSMLCESGLACRPVISRLGDIPIYTAALSVLKGITGFNLTEGMLCAMKRKPLPDIRALCEGARRIAVLEHVMNPTNVGAIMRSAAALGIDALLLSHDCADPLYRRACRVGRGTAFCLPYGFFEKGKTQENILLLKALGFKTAAMALEDDSISADDKRLKDCERLAIVLGSEGEGLTGQTLAQCDYTVKIPMKRGVDSLNVAAASAVIFWSVC